MKRALRSSEENHAIDKLAQRISGILEEVFRA